MKVLSIGQYETSCYLMYRRYDTAFLQKVIFTLEGNKVSPTDTITYVCDCCGATNKTIVRTFNDRLGTYGKFDYICKVCVHNSVHLTTEDKTLKIQEAKKKEVLTKTKNKSRPRDLIASGKRWGVHLLDQTSGSSIREKMNHTKRKNNTFGDKGSDTYRKRIETYNKKTDEEITNIALKARTTKITNQSTSGQKVQRGDTFGFVNPTPENLEYYKAKIRYKLNEVQENGLTLMVNVARKRVKNKRLKGDYIRFEDIEGFKVYKLLVRSLTEQTYKIYKDSINPFNLKRTRSDKYAEAFHLDHKFSIKEGFDNHVLPYIIASKENLEMLSHRENCSKHAACSLKLNDLYKLMSSGQKEGELLGTP